MDGDADGFLLANDDRQLPGAGQPCIEKIFGKENEVLHVYGPDDHRILRPLGLMNRHRVGQANLIQIGHCVERRQNLSLHV